MKLTFFVDGVIECADVDLVSELVFEEWQVLVCGNDFQIKL